MSIAALGLGAATSLLSLLKSQLSPAQNNHTQNSPFKDLMQSLKVGDLNGAQKALNSLQQLMHAKGGANITEAISSDLAAISNSLQVGDINAAQQAFVKLQQDMQTQGIGMANHHHYSANAASHNSTNTISNGTSTNSSDNSISIKV